jgi:hypothetical protein
MNKKQLSKSILNRSDAEFLLEQAANGKFRIRIGQIWSVSALPIGQSLLLLDLDNCNKPPDRRAIRKRISKCGLSVLQIKSKRSPSRTGYHVAITVAGKLSRIECVALQAICESDPHREAQNFRRARLALKDWRGDWNVLYI